MNFPNDANGDVLRRMQAAGDDLGRPRDVDFTGVFPDKEAAEKFADHFLAQGYAASVEFTEINAEFPWDVVVVKHMTPTHEGIGEFEASVQSAANSFGGRSDGWGCLSEPPSSS